MNRSPARNRTRLNIRFLPLVILCAIIFMTSFSSTAAASLFENRTGGFWSSEAGFAGAEGGLNAGLHRVYKTFSYDFAPGSLVAPKSAGAIVKSDGLSFGLKLGRHAQLERMAERGVSQKMVDAALRKGQTFWDPVNKTLQFALNPTSGKNIGIAVNPVTKTVTTVMRQSKSVIRPRFVQISREAAEQMLK